MKNIFAIAISGVIAGSVYSQNVGINQASPSQRLDVVGWVKVGNESAGSSGTAGTIRYHSSGKLQFFNGSVWVDINAQSTTFVNWGRNDCPSGSTLVYSGPAGGGHYDHSGSGANTMCLTSSPVYATFSDADNNGALVYGVEYEMSGYGLASIFIGLHDRDAVCAVCEVNGASETLLMPGTTACPSGWTSRYTGYLMANHYTQRKSEYVCVNGSPMVTGSTGNSNGSLWYPTETEMGALVSGSPYFQDREMTCVICTQ